ncbi:MAG: efflux RND transporter permease subunit [Chromatiales bacterium]|jgi:HAE1 family hydrophobic/amphiphilic exporter-1|nr:efflux RND transporter permease subunit [Chromatiales bacterium]
MSLASVSVKRYVFAAMLNAVLVVFGFFAWDRLGIERLPNIDLGTISVLTRLDGANPEIVDSSVTNVVEGAISSIPGIDQLVSSTSAGQSLVTPTFQLGKDIDIAFNEVQAKVSQVRGQLPDDADVPVITKANTGGFPSFWITITGDRTIQELNQYARTVVRKRLETIDGVGEVVIGGERTRTIRVNLDFERLTAFGITVQDVIAAFRNQHFQLPGGYLVENAREQLLKLDLEYHRPEDLERLILTYRLGSPIYLRDVATIEDSLSDARRVGRYNGRAAVGLGIIKVAGQNSVDIANEIKRRINREIIPNLPPGLEVKISADDSLYIIDLVNSLEEHLIYGALFAALVVWFFLRSFRATLIVAAAIPVSLLGAALVMFFLGYTLNTITMLALLLLIGVVVDDAIVVLENIQRKVEGGETDRAKASVDGANEVLLAIVASTLVLACIFAVVVFVPGVPGKLIGAFGVVVALGVLVSLFVSLTLTPMLCSRHLKVEAGEVHGLVHRRITGWLDAMETRYRGAIGWSLRHRWLVVAGAIGIVALTPFIFMTLGGEFFPAEDEGQFQVTLRTPAGSSLEYGDERMRRIEEIVLSHPEIESVFATLGGGRANSVSNGVMYVNMLPRDQRKVTQSEMIRILRDEFAEVPGIVAFPAPYGISGSSRGDALAFVLQGPDLETTAQLAREFRDRLAQKPELGQVDLDLELDLPQVRLEVNRDLAAEFGLTSREVAEAANVLAGGLNVAKYSDEPGDGERYDIRLKAAGDVNLQDLSKIYLRGPNRDLIRLDTVAKFTELAGPATITRVARQYAASFFSDPTVSLGEAVDIVRREADDFLPPGYTLKLQGGSEQLDETSSGLGLVFGLALLLVYGVLASQFNSYLQPLIIMVAQPLAIIGGVAALAITGNTLNLYSIVGLILLIGLVAKNSILLVDLTNQLREQGMAVDEALAEACPRRLRPILMTSLTIIFAMLVPALGFGTGVELSGPLSVAVIGGMISSTLLTLVVVPAVYSLVESGRGRESRFSPRAWLAKLPLPGRAPS